MKIDRLGTKCDRCDHKIRWWQGYFNTEDGRHLHSECFKEEVMVMHFVALMDKYSVNKAG